jgi:pyruvate dehydrogenase E2 component (dihydrolipoamide acetyltransferase)
VSDQRIVPVTMPKWGLSMQMGKITAWLVSLGEEIKPGDDLADIETDKITGTLEAAQGGLLRRIIGRVGEDVPVGGTIALIAPAEVSEEDLDSAAAEARAVIDAGVPADAGAPEVQTAVGPNGQKISYAGAGGPGADGDVVLLIHGYGGDRNSWLFLQEPLAARHRVYALDLPGHGTSGKDVGDGSIGILADAVVAVLDAVGAQTAHLVGHSLGGAVALAVAARGSSGPPPQARGSSGPPPQAQEGSEPPPQAREGSEPPPQAREGSEPPSQAAPLAGSSLPDPADRIASVTLIAPVGFGPEINAGYLRGFAGARTRRELKPVVGQLFADEHLVTRQVVDDLLAYKRLDGVDQALHALLGKLLDGDAQRLDSAGDLAVIGDAVPVTVVWGSADRIIPAAQSESVAGASRVVIDDAGHMPHMERPGEVMAAIEETIARAR